MRLLIPLLAVAAWASLGCATTKLKPPEAKAAQPTEHVEQIPLEAGWERWVGFGVGSHWKSEGASLGNQGELVLAEGRRILLHDLSTGNALRSFVIDPAPEDERARDGRIKSAVPTLTAISADGARIAAVMGANLTIFGRDSGERLVNLQFDYPPFAIAFSADGAKLLALSMTRGKPSTTLEVLDIRSKALASMASFPLNESVRLNGDFVVVEVSSGPPTQRFEVRDWDGVVVRTWAFTEAARVAFNQDGSRAAVLGGDGTLRVLEQAGSGPANDEKTVWSRPLERMTTALAFTADGSELLVSRKHAGPDEVSRIDAATGTTRSTHGCTCLGAPHFSPDGRWALGDSSLVACLLELGLPPAPTCRDHRREVSTLAERAGKVLVKWGRDGRRVLAFDARTGAPLPLPELERPYSACCGCATAVTSGQERVVVDWNAPNRATSVEHAGTCVEVYRRASETATRAIAATTDCLALYEAQKSSPSGWGEAKCLTSPGTLDGQSLLSADGRWAVAVGENDVVTIWNLDRRKLEHVFDQLPEENGAAVLAAFAADGSWVYVKQPDPGGDTLAALRRGDAEARWSYEAKGEIVGVALRPGSEQLAVALRDGRVLLFDGSAEPRQLADLSRFLDYATALHWLEDAPALVIGTSRGAVLVHRR